MHNLIDLKIAVECVLVSFFLRDLVFFFSLFLSMLYLLKHPCELNTRVSFRKYDNLENKKNIGYKF